MTILIGVPTYDNSVRSEFVVSLMSEMATPGCPPFTLAFKQLSLLALAHNEILVLALNNRPAISHLLIVHSDILPDPGFVGQMLHDMQEAKADVLGAIVPIKDSKGLTSTALLPHLGSADVQGRYEFRRRRLTMAEAARLPDIFDVHDVQRLFEEDSPDAVLLVNTGMLLIDMACPAIEQVHFEVNDDIFRKDDGQFYADVEPEDWYFSRLVAQHGARVCVTRRVGLRHAGRGNFPNKQVWGDWATDRMYPGAASNGDGVKAKENGHEETALPATLHQ